VRDVNENLGSQISAATALADQLKAQLAESDAVVRRLSKIAVAARPLTETDADAPRVSAARANAAAAQAFAERRRPDGIAA
jgi:hypothetical protein